MSIEKQRGTICDASWDNKDASVLCREKGFSEGVAVPGAAYGQGTGNSTTSTRSDDQHKRCLEMWTCLCVIK